MALDPDKMRLLERYAKLSALASSPGNANEKANATKALAELEAEHPGLRALAARVETAMNPNPFKSSPFPGPTPGFPPPGATNSEWKDLLRAAATGFGTKAAEGVSGMLGMPEPLGVRENGRPKNYAIIALSAPLGEERIEVRWRKALPEAVGEKMLRVLERLVLAGSYEG